MPGAPHETGECNGVPDCGDCMVSYRLGLESMKEKAMSKWKPGDVVRLKTGGWTMTVEQYCTEDKHDVGTLSVGSVRETKNVSCVWFEKRPSAYASSGSPLEYTWDGPKYGSFHEDALEATEAAR